MLEGVVMHYVDFTMNHFLREYRLGLFQKLNSTEET
jgi:hypothetical protein